MTAQAYKRVQKSRASRFEGLARGHILELDGLRGLAVLAVLINHLNKDWLPGGFLGVDLFFVLSGFVVTRSFLSRPSKGIRSDLLGFYARRVFRIVPALVVCLTVTTLLAALFIPDSWLSQATWKTGSFAFWGFSNIPLIEADGYFSHRSDFNPFTQTWSLAVEEQFYFLAPLLLLAWQRVGRGTASSFFFGFVRALLPCLILASLIYSAFYLNPGSNLAFYSMPSRFWELGVGVLLSLYWGRIKVKSLRGYGLGRIQYWVAPLGLSLLMIGFWFGSSSLAPWPVSLLPVAGTSLVIIGCLSHRGAQFWPRIALRTKCLLWLGGISYSLYLWHWPVIVLMRWTVGIDRWWLVLIAVVVSFALAFVSTFYIERPIMRWGKAVNISSLLQILLGLVSVVGFWGLSVQAEGMKSQYSWTDVNRRPHRWFPDRVDSLGQSSSSPTLFITGDSHAYAYGSMLKRFHAELGWNVRTIGLSMCFAGRLIDGFEVRPNCLQDRARLIQQLQDQSKPGDVLVLAGLRMPRLVESWGRNNLDFSSPVDVDSVLLATSRREGMVASQELMAALKPLGLRVVFEAPKPVLNAPLMRCSEWFNSVNQICGEPVLKSDFIHYRSPTMKQMSILADEFDFVEIWDPADVLCPGEFCTGTEGGSRKPLYYDGDHLSAIGSKRAFDSLSSFLLK
ncbi:acyltransferase family protein [Synechococcus sp. MIT S9452]|uniref:acyltransferase family protein n=1 Tax=Synechococcus sp. MIT S9452 TaxID=3082546 RepID=UPI0039A512F4